MDAQLSRGLRSAGAVLLEGPKACGKTSTARRQAASVVRLDASPQVRAAGEADPNLLLSGDTPRLVDEWQLVPGVWNAVRYQVDERQADGQFILTGSATPADDATRHTGAGRFARIRMAPMTLHETGHGTGAVSLARLFDGEAPSTFTSQADPTDIAELLSRGGWPGNPHMRSSVQVRKAPKRHLADPSLAVAALGAGPKALLGDLEAFGQHFESLVFRDLSVYAQAAGAAVHAYQESTGAEIDAVVVRDDEWIGIEVKLSARPQVIDPAAAGLLRIASRMRTPPAALAVVTATGPSYRRPDGVHVISILDLGP